MSSHCRAEIFPVTAGAQSGFSPLRSSWKKWRVSFSEYIRCFWVLRCVVSLPCKDSGFPQIFKILPERPEFCGAGQMKKRPEWFRTFRRVSDSFLWSRWDLLWFSWNHPVIRLGFTSETVLYVGYSGFRWLILLHFYTNYRVRNYSRSHTGYVTKLPQCVFCRFLVTRERMILARSRNYPKACLLMSWI